MKQLFLHFLQGTYVKDNSLEEAAAAGQAAGELIENKMMDIMLNCSVISLSFFI